MNILSGGEATDREVLVTLLVMKGLGHKGHIFVAVEMLNG